jgi:L-alanine-DL-glutamate epimerase-like enolase superfamily enzyme
MKADYRIFELPFQYPFTISKGTKTHQPTFVVSLEHFGRTGYGEAPAIHYYDVTTAKLEMVFKAKKMFIEKFAFTEPERYWHYLHHLLPIHPFLVCALDIAGWDLYGKLHGRPLRSFWSKYGDPAPPTDYTIVIDDPQKMVEKMKAKHWPIYKIKVGTDNDIEIIETLR